MRSHHDIKFNFIETNEDSFNKSFVEPLFKESVIEDYYGGINYPGAIKIFMECSHRMLEALPLRHERLSKAVESDHFFDIIYLAHQLKGSFGATGSPLLARLCASLEQSAKLNRGSDCKDIMSQITMSISPFVVHLQNYIDQLMKFKSRPGGSNET